MRNLTQTTFLFHSQDSDRKHKVQSKCIAVSAIITEPILQRYKKRSSRQGWQRLQCRQILYNIKCILFNSKLPIKYQRLKIVRFQFIQNVCATVELRSVLKIFPNLEMKIAQFSCFKIETGNIRLNDQRKLLSISHFKFCKEKMFLGHNSIGTTPPGPVGGGVPVYGIFELNLNPLSSNNIHNISPSDTKSSTSDIR